METRAEWEPLSEEERAVVAALSQRIPGFDSVSPELLLAFVRGYLSDGVEVTERLLRECLEWRALPEIQADVTLLQPPPDRREFEAMYQAGPVGRDLEGRAIVLERPGVIPVARFCKLNEAFLVRQNVYTKEATRTLCRELSHAAGRRFYKAVVIVDLNGFSLRHAKPDALRILRLLISKFQESYPEFMVATYLINAPTIFTGLWAMVRPWLDPKVTAKVHVLGGEKAYIKFFADKGFVFDQPLSSAKLRLSWMDEMCRLLACGAPPPPFVPEEDRAFLTSLSLNRATAADEGGGSEVWAGAKADEGVVVGNVGVMGAAMQAEALSGNSNSNQSTATADKL